MIWSILWACSGDPKSTAPMDSGNASTCLTDEEYYVQEIEPTLQSKCEVCHNAEGIASDTQMSLGESSTDNFQMLSELALSREGGEYLLLQKPTNQHPDGHGGGQPITSNSAEYEALELFVGRINGLADDCDQSVDLSEEESENSCDREGSPSRLLRRLSHVEYDNSIRDLFGISGEWAVNFATDNVLHGYDNNASALLVSPILLDQYAAAAESIAAEVLSGTIIASLGCPVQDIDCAETFLLEKGTEIFRRPLSTKDINNYLEAYELAADDGFDSGMTWMIATMLQSPHFLYRSELGQRQNDDLFALTSWEIATELSYLFLQSTPDLTLMSLAEDGVLIDEDIIEEQVQRLLLDSRSSESMIKMSDQWLGLKGLDFVPRDTEVYPELTADIREAMATETQLFLAQHYSANASFSDLLTQQHSWMNSTLAHFYGVSGVDDSQFREVDLSSDPRYGGLLTQGALNTVHALPTSSSPIHRGVLIRERFLCQHLPPPPANLDTSPPVVDSTLSTRERYAQHSSDPACAGCHDMIDPIGFGFENYDGIGRWRDIEGAHEIDASGEILQSMSSDGSFIGVDGLSVLLAQSKEVSSCYVQQWFVYGTGLGELEDPEVSCALSLAIEQFDSSGGALQSAPVALAQLHRLTSRYGGLGEMDSLAVSASDDPTDPDDTGEPDTSEPDDPADPISDLSVVVDEVSNWGSGYCSNVIVTNNSSSEETWVIVESVAGTISSLWNAVSEPVSGGIQFSGVSWNETLQSNQSAEFGFCADL